MKLVKLIPFFTLLLCTVATHAQTENAFLTRDFWKTNPSVAQVDEKIAVGNDVSALNSNFFDGVTYAILEKVDNATIEYLLTKKGNDVNKRTHDARTYIFWAAYRDNIDLMQHLVDIGADTKIIDSHGYSVVTFAATTGQINPKLYDFLIANGTNLITEKSLSGANSLLLVAPHLKSYDLIDYFVSKGVALDAKDTNGNGIFNYTAKGGSIEILKTLVTKKIDYKTLNNLGGNAMLSASKGRRGFKPSLETFTYLESLGINPNIVNKNGTTPLHAIAYNTKNTSIFDYFISKGVAINQADSEGNTAFLNAVSRNDMEAITYLSKHIKNINHTNKDGKSALTYAVYRNTPEVVEFLLSKGADATIKDNKGNNLAFYLSKNYSPEDSREFDKKLSLLSEKGFDFTQTQENGNTLYHLAANKNDLDLMQRIKDLKLNINAKNKEGNTALHIAAMKSENEMILKYLVNSGADKNTKTEFYESAFDLASENELLKKNNVELNFLQ